MGIGVEPVAGTHGRDDVIGVVEDVVHRRTLREFPEVALLCPRQHRLATIRLPPENGCYLTVCHFREPDDPATTVHDFGTYRARLRASTDARAFRSDENQPI